MEIKNLEIITKELLDTLDMKECRLIPSADVATRINDAYGLTFSNMNELDSIYEFVVQYFIDYFNNTKNVTTNDLLVYSAIVYVLTEYINIAVLTISKKLENEENEKD